MQVPRIENYKRINIKLYRDYWSHLMFSFFGRGGVRQLKKKLKKKLKKLKPEHFTKKYEFAVFLFKVALNSEQSKFSLSTSSTIWQWINYIALSLTETNACLSNPCMNGGTCHTVVNMFQCECDLGSIGVNCETSMITNYSNQLIARWLNLHAYNIISMCILY